MESSSLLRHTRTLRTDNDIVTAMRWTDNGLSFFTRHGLGFLADDDERGASRMIDLEGLHIAHAAWSGSGIHLAIAIRGAVEIYDVLSKDRVLTLPVRGIRNPSRVKWSLFDGHIAVAAGAVRVFDTATGEEVACFPSHAAGIHAMTWSPDGRLIASADEWGKVRINDLESGHSEELPFAGAAQWTIAWSPCGRFLVTEFDEESLQVIDLERQTKVATLAHRAVRFSLFQTLGIHSPPKNDAALFLTKCGSATRLWRTCDWQLVATIPDEGSNYILTEAAFHPYLDGLVTTCDADSAVQFWKISRDLAQNPLTTPITPDPTAPIITIFTAAPMAKIYEPRKVRRPTFPKLVAAVDSAKTADAKGKSLEALIEALLTTIEGWRIAQRLRNTSEEFDITISNRCEQKPHSDWGELLLVECKNRSDKSGAPDIRALIGKMAARRGRCRTAILVSWSGFTSGTDEVLVETRTTEHLVMALSGSEVRAAAEQGDFGEMLSEKYWNALMR